MFVVFVPIRHLRTPQRSATDHRFDRPEMQRFVRHLRRCCVGEEIEFTATAWVKQGVEKTLSLGMLVDVDGDVLQFSEHCTRFKVTLVDGGTKEEPVDLLETAARHGMVPAGTKFEGESLDCFGRNYSEIGTAGYGR